MKQRTCARLAAALGLACLLGCTRAPEDAVDAAPPTEAYQALMREGARLERGRLLSLSCVPCHTFDRDGEHTIGPNLYQVLGRPAASRSGFEYSAALRAAGIVWTPETLDAWLADPAAYVPGNGMAFAGYASADDRRDLIAYLLRETRGRVSEQ
jgi:cytochrome c